MRYIRNSAVSTTSGACATRPRNAGSKSPSTSPSSARRITPGCASTTDWFAWRPDGSMKFAENPPKKYEDIVNVDFYAEASHIPDLWVGLCEVVLFWARAGRAHLPRR